MKLYEIVHDVLLSLTALLLLCVAVLFMALTLKKNRILKSKVKDLSELSVTDDLTRVFNRRHFQATLPLEIKRARRFKTPFSLLMIDMDHFKKLNDRYGHRAGDKCLKEFAHVLGARVREVDFLGRYGGEEFVLILPGAAKEDGLSVAEKIRSSVKGHRFSMTDGGDRETLTVSIGVSSYPEDGESVEDLIDAADIALYDAKRAGRNRVVSAKSQDLLK